MSVDKMEAARRLVKAATGEEYGDGMTVTDMGVGIAERGYGYSDTVVWVAGDWNNRDRYDSETGKRVVTSTVPSRLGNALERIGIELLWCDEWQTCCHCYKAIRTEPSSYSWTPYYLTDYEACELMCLDCFDSFYEGDEGIREFGFVNNPAKAVPDHITDNQLIAWGWESYNGTYEHGLYGREDKPATIYDGILAERENVDVLFRYATQQFCIRFTAWIKEREDDSE